jgi:3D (Asp-Asp-Asp) domain-containing protein
MIHPSKSPYLGMTAIAVTGNSKGKDKHVTSTGIPTRQKKDSLLANANYKNQIVFNQQNPQQL